MRLVRIGVAAVSVKVGDFAGNAARLKAIIAEAKRRKVHLLVTPELCVSGYSLEDRVWWPEISRRSWESLLDLAKACKGITAFFGLPVRIDSLMYNAAALVHDGKLRGVILKKYLPTYSIFYEGRNWTAWRRGVTEAGGVPAGDLVFDLPFGKVSAEICEDLWSTNSPAHARARAGAEIICNASGSPFTPLKNEHRRKLILGASSSLACVYAYSNILGLDNSRLVFDGGGIIATPEGVVAEGPLLSKQYWTLTTGIVDLDDIARQRSENTTWRLDATAPGTRDGIELVDACDGTFIPASVKDYAAQLPKSFYVPGASWTVNDATKYLDELFDALVLGLRDYFEKVGAFDKFLVALSGGRDSALCLLLAVHAAMALREGKDKKTHWDRVETVYLPNKAYSSKATEDAARALAHELGVPFKVVSIEEESGIALKKAGEMAGSPKKVSALAKQNLQARVRGNMMLNWANSANALLLVTSNLSEAAVGYTTTGGDNQGGYSPIANVPKTLVSRLIEHIAHRDGIKSIQKILDIPPSAELAPDQKDEADLMPYVVLDDLLYLFARRRMSLTDCWRVLVHRHPGHSADQLKQWTARFGKLFVYSQWKREQLPVTMKVLDLDLDPKTGFRFPVTQSIDDELRDLASAKLEPTRR
ncbi:MAG: NAD(+) synthase [Candidatus Hydrogenedentes bacterium]|nr:NAD(+) synthase [Candidatus Hydrogenedentota bacterium]